MKLDIRNKTDVEINEGRLANLAAKAQKLVAGRDDSLMIPEGSLLTLVLTDNKEIQHFNSEYRGKDEATDVLSFGYLEGEVTPLVPGESIGEVIISLERTEKQAAERGVRFEDELEFLFVHGFLHIAGYTHENDEKRQVMFGLTDEIMGKSLPPYSG